MKNPNVTILGATGAVGREMLKILEERNFPIGELRCLASARSVGKKLPFAGREIMVEEATDAAFTDADIVLGAAENDIARRFAPAIKATGAVFIDNSSAFRMDEDVPLVVPEINPEDALHHHGIIATPNCSTIITVVAVVALRRLSPITSMVAATYQAVSGAGKEGIDELTEQVKAVSEGRPVEAKILPSASLDKHYQIAFNLLPQIDVFLPDGYTKEEMKMVHETRKIMGEPAMPITATTVRVPVYRSHSESVNLELEQPLSVEEAKQLLAAFPGVIVQDDPAAMEYPMPLFTSSRDEVFVGRIRQDDSIKHGLNLWVVGDQIRKGAALNALQIAELMIAENLL